MDNVFQVKMLDRETIEDQLKVYKAAFNSNGSYEELKEYWTKKHYMNPVHDSYVFGAYDGDKLISMNAYMPMRYKFGDRTVNVIQSCESGTLPEYQGKGLWSKVVKFAIKTFQEMGEFDFLLGFPNYENSYGGFMKMNWNHDTDIINYIMVVNGSNFVKAAIGKSISLGRLLEIQKLRLSTKLMKKYSIISYEYKEKDGVTGFDLEISKEFLQWKQDYKNVNLFGIKNNDTNSVAICSYKLDTFKGNKIALLYRIDYKENSDLLKDLYSVSIQEIIRRNNDVAFIRAWAMPESKNEEALKSLGFFKSKHRNPFITYQLKDDVISRNELLNQKNWCDLTFLDLD